MEDVKRQEEAMKEHNQLELLKHKRKEDESAVASTSVKAKLQQCILSKKQNKAQSHDRSPPQLKW